MLKLRQIASNMTEAEIGPITILFSYSTPVAGFNPVYGPNETGHFKTDRFFSQTTSRHINKYFRNEWDVNPDDVRTVSQDRIDSMAQKVVYK